VNRRKMQIHYTRPIWNYRLQLLWVAFTALYISVGTFYIDQWVSSLMVTMGAILILALVAHILPSKDISSVRPTLLLAFASCLFLTQESLNVYEDELAAAFSAIIGVCCALLAWIEHEQASKILRRMVFSVLILLVATSISQLLATLIIKSMISHQVVREEVYIIAPHSLGVAAGAMLGFSYGSYLVKNSPHNLVLWRTILSFVVFFILATITGYLFNDKRIALISSEIVVGVAYTAVYTFLYLIIVLKFVAIYITNNNSTRIKIPCLVDFLVFLPIVICLSSLATNALFFAHFSPIDYPFIESFFTDLLSNCFLAVVLASSFAAIRWSTRLLHEDFERHNKSKGIDN